MPQYLSPGVYIEEPPVGPHPIQGVSTSTTGMVGVTVRGPAVGKPKLVTSFNDFQRTFGGFLPTPDPTIVNTWSDPKDGGAWWLFPLAVKGFFDNGGQLLYVKRVVAKEKSKTVPGATSATGTFKGGLFADVTKTSPKDAREISVSHLVGIDTTTVITLKYLDPASPPHDQSFKPQTYDTATGKITLPDNVTLDQELRAGRDLVLIKAQDTNDTFTVTAIDPGEWGNGINVRVTPVVTTLGLLVDGAPFATQLTTKADKDVPTVDVAAVPGLDTTTPHIPPPFLVQIDQKRFQVTKVEPTEQGALRLTLKAEDGGDPTHNEWPIGLPVRRVRYANQAGAGPTLRVAGARRLYPNAIVELDNGTVKQTLQVAEKDAVKDDVVTFTTNANAGYLEDAKLHLIEAQVVLSYTDGTGAPIEESFSNLRLGDKDPQGAVARINGQSQLVTVAQPVSLVSKDDFRLPVGPQGPALPLGSGLDNYASLTVDDFVGSDGGSGLRTGIQALEDIDEIAICAVPGMWSQTVQGSLIEHCELLKDRFAILDPSDGLDIEGISTFRQGRITQYAALYYPWCITRDSLSGNDVRVPPSGHLAGVYADTDDTRGVHKAPANVVVRGIKLLGGLAQDITKREQDVINPVGINALRFFPGLGERVWGARTLSSDSDWKYINVRRLFIYVEKSIYNGTQWVVFEPNDEQLWALVRQTISAFLTTTWRSGALAGTTPEEAFFVRCDRTTMTQDDRDNGRLICIVGLAPVYPAEFVIFRFEQKTSTSQQA
jgi:phage tail sheath protein FI